MDGADEAIVIRADSRALAVAAEVIDNAIKYSPGNVVRVHAAGMRPRAHLRDRRAWYSAIGTTAIFGSSCAGAPRSTQLKGRVVRHRSQIVTAHGGEIVRIASRNRSTCTLLLRSRTDGMMRGRIFLVATTGHRAARKTN